MKVPDRFSHPQKNPRIAAMRIIFGMESLIRNIKNPQIPAMQIKFHRIPASSYPPADEKNVVRLNVSAVARSIPILTGLIPLIILYIMVFPFNFKIK